MIRLALRLTILILWLLVALLFHGLWRLVRTRSPWPPVFLGGVARIVGARPRIIGTPLKRDVVFLANHLSWIDILLLAGATGTAFVAKDSLAKVPLIGWLCGLNDTLFVERGDRLGVAAQVAQLRAALARPRPIAIFPEGTTSDGTTLLPFKAALLAALDPAPPGHLIQPVRIDYGPATNDLAWVGEELGHHHAARVLRRRGGFVATLHFLEPLAPEGGRKAIAAQARARIAAIVDETTSLTAEELATRRPVWTALSNLFLDTDVALLRDGDARVLGASPYSLDRIERILIDEVTPACGANLRSVAGEWAGFDEAWLETRIAEVRIRRRPGQRMRLMWPDWLLLRSQVARLRDAERSRVATDPMMR